MDKEITFDGTMFRKLRKKMNKTLLEVATAINISDAYLSKIERDQFASVGQQVLIGLCDYFGLKVNEILEREEQQRGVDLIKTLYMTEVLMLDGVPIPITDDLFRERVEAGIRMGIAWAREHSEERGN